MKRYNSSIVYFLLIVLFGLQALPVFAQTEVTVPMNSSDDSAESAEAPENDRPRRVDERSGMWLFQWGYNRENYTPSDIHFTGPGYSFTLKDVKGNDKPEKINEKYVTPSYMAVPQYNFRISHYFTDNFNISFGQDHMKYVMSDNQPSRIQGYIDPLAIQRASYNPSLKSIPYLYLFPGNVDKYAGYHYGETINISPDFLQYEHTDGLNYFFIDVGFSIPLWVSEDGQTGMTMVSSVGGGPVVLRSDVRLFGEGVNNHFHLSGYAVSGYVGLRIDLISHLYIEVGGKAGYIDLPDVLVNGRSKDRASQHMGFLEQIVYVGTPVEF